jgi:hypothetical protein
VAQAAHGPRLAVTQTRVGCIILSEFGLSRTRSGVFSLGRPLRLIATSIHSDHDADGLEAGRHAVATERAGTMILDAS